MEWSSELICGLIMMVVLGPSVGNYATSVVYRLPRAQTPFEKHPYCGGCGTMLAPKDLAPLLSYFWLKGKCRYCGMKIRFTYTAIELACLTIFVIDFLLFGISEQFILVTSIGVFFTILCGLEVHEKKLFILILTYLFALGAMLRILQDDSIYPFFFSGFIMLFAGAVLWRILVAMGKMDGKKTPDFLWLMVLAGVMLPLPLLAPVTIGAVLLYGVQRAICPLRTLSIPAALAIYGGLLF